MRQYQQLQQAAAVDGPPAPVGSEAGFDWWAAPRSRAKARPRPVPETPRPPSEEAAERSRVYRSVQSSPEFREIRARYRGFAFPACAFFLVWYLVYMVGAVVAPGLMGRRIAGPLNLAWVLGLAQFASTFLLAALYARHARVKRDRAALGLRWDTQDRLR